MAIDAVIWVTVANLLVERIISNFPVSPTVQTTLEQFREKLLDTKKILDGTEDDNGRALTVADWKIKLLQAVHQAEDAILTYLLSTNFYKQKVFIKFPSFLRSSKVQFLFRNEMKKCLDQITDSVPVELRKRTSDQNPEYNSKGFNHFRRDHYELFKEIELFRREYFGEINNDNEEDIVGFGSEVSELRRSILTSENLLIPVVGVAGSGKTTLVKSVYNRLEIKKIFHNRAWVCVSQDFEEKYILVQILKQVTDGRDEEKLPLEKLQQKLGKLLNRKRVLIVLDDVRAPAMWEKLQVVFPNSSNGCRVILTTRDPDVATHIDPVIPLLRVSPLTEDESWSLFLKKARREPGAEVFSRGQIREKILGKCGGLPIAVCLLAGLLTSSKFSIDARLGAIEDVVQKENEEKREVSEDSGEIKQIAGGMSEQTQHGADATGEENPSASLNEPHPSNILALAYNGLPSRLKACLMYLCLFPRSYEIPIRRLLLLWIAEGLMRPLEDPSAKKSRTPFECLWGSDFCSEDLAEGCLKQLMYRNLIEVACWRLDGSPKTCFLASTLYDTLFPIAERMGYFHVHSSSHSTPRSSYLNIRRLIEYVDIEKNSISDRETQHLCSYISFNSGTRGKPSDASGKFLNKIVTRGFGLLTVLDLEGVYKPALPETLGRKLPLLGYVGLRRTFLNSIPESVGDLRWLETLDVKHTLITTLPNSIWKIKNLRHLYMSGIFLEVAITDNAFPTELKTLWGVVIGDSRGTVDWLTSLKGIRKLGLTCHTNSILEITDWIFRQTSLRSLRLKSVDDNNKPSRIDFPFTVRPKMLSNLYLVGMIDEGDLGLLSRNLRVLTLSGSHLSDDPMQTLERLRHLKVLRLFANSYSGKKMRCRSGWFAFPRLQVLKLWMLTELREWTIDEGAMPALRDVEIRCCKRLEKPIGLENLTSLKELTLTSMKKDFVDEVKRSIGEDVVVIENHWNFQPLFD